MKDVITATGCAVSRRSARRCSWQVVDSTPEV